MKKKKDLGQHIDHIYVITMLLCRNLTINFDFIVLQSLSCFICGYTRVPASILLLGIKNLQRSSAFKQEVKQKLHQSKVKLHSAFSHL